MTSAPPPSLPRRLAVSELCPRRSWGVCGGGVSAVGECREVWWGGGRALGLRGGRGRDIGELQRTPSPQEPGAPAEPGGNRGSGPWVTRQADRMSRQTDRLRVGTGF